MNDLVSIIVPVYNVEKYVRRCIDSIVSQTHKHIEIILVDDGSPDHCPRICDDYANKDMRIKVIHQANQGLSVARNTGLDNSNGEWYCFVDSDDFVDKHFVELLLRTVKENDAISARCKRKFTYKSVSDVKNPLFKTKVFNCFEYLIYLDHTVGYGIHSVCWGIYHKSLFENLRFTFLHTEDTPVSAQIMFSSYNNKFAVCNQTLYFYFQSPNSIMRRTSLVNIERYKAYEWLLDYWVQKNEWEAYDCYFKVYFTNLVNDYTELRRDLPKQSRTYEFLFDKIKENYRQARRLNLKIISIPPCSKEVFNELLLYDGKIILYGFGLNGNAMLPWLEYFGIPIYEVWDRNFELYSESKIQLYPPRQADGKDKTKIIISIEDEQETLRIRRNLRQMGYNDFVLFDNVAGAIRYAKYSKYLPFMLDFISEVGL